MFSGWERPHTNRDAEDDVSGGHRGVSKTLKLECAAGPGGALLVFILGQEGKLKGP